MLTYKCTTEEPLRAGEVQFGLLSAEDIRKMSVVNVTDTTIYYRGLPNPHGINDHRMGTVDRRLFCGTCCNDVKDCQGHVGHIELSYPMYHIGFFDTTFKILRCVCFICSRVCLSDEEMSCVSNDTGKHRFTAVYNSIKPKKKCPHCQMTQPQYVRLSLSIKTEWPSDVVFASKEEMEYCTRPFTQFDALSILTNMTDADCAFLGFNPELCHPKNMVLTVILVPPPVSRPAIMASEGSRSRGQDDLTHKLQDINKKSIELKSLIEDGSLSKKVITAEVMDKINKLQFEVFTYMNNNIRGQKLSTQRSGAPTKSLTDRLRGKDGRIRGNLMGKRVNFSARSVISPDALMDVDEVGIPERIAMTLTVPERVNACNIEELTERVMNGPHHLKGAESVITSSGVVIYLEHCKARARIRLQYGWIVERFLQDNDIVVFNRQPSLHKMGMMGHRVKIMNGYTFRLNLCCANPYNADFDGDEMNLHVPQSPAAIADVASIMMVSRQIVSPQANRPVMGIVQDALLGGHLMSMNDVFMTREKACHIVGMLKFTRHALPAPCVERPVELWSGKQLLSLLLPGDFEYGRLCHKFEELDKSLRVVNGQIVTGVLVKSHLGSSAGGFVDILFREYGSTKTVQWMSDMQRVVNTWLMNRGFSVGVKDCVLSAKGERRVAERIKKAMELADDICSEDVKSGSRESNIVESTVVRILSKTLMQTGGIVDEELGTNNAIRSMVTAGSKGNPINLSQICGCVGQQNIEGRRVFAEKGGRTLSCFDFTDTSLAGRGFVENSYALGLHPHEYFFHAMGGREGLVDTAVKTATTGYIQRRQIKAMEDHKVAYDGTVRNGDEKIVDFVYGGDGFDAARVERCKLSLLEEDDASIAQRMSETDSCMALESKEALLACKKHGDGILDTRILLPFNLDRTPFRPSAMGDAEEALQRVVTTWLCTQTSHAIRAAVLNVYHTKALCSLRSSVDDVSALFERLQRKIDDARVHFGEMVGSVAAQSVGEPATQMTLNTFHLSGVGNKNVTQGIPRLKELLDQSKQIKTPCVSIRFKQLFAHNKEFVTYFANTLPLTRLGEIVSNCELIYDPDFTTSVVADDVQMVQDDFLWHDAPESASKYVIRLTLNQSIMKSRRITPPIVRKLLRNRLGSKCNIVSSETNSIDWIVRLRFAHVSAMMASMNLDTDKEGLLCHRIISMLLDTVAVSGHKDILHANIRKCDRTNEYIIDTQGHNIVDMSIAPCVDWYRTTSNDVSEIHATLGIEAAVNVLFAELMSTISFDGTYVDPRHIMMIVNTMTRGGYIMPLSRHGINRMDTGPLLRCTFEETPDILCDAACFGELDNGRGVSQNIIAGRLANIGSGLPNIQMHSSCLHPRSLNVKSQKTKKILKSKIRNNVEPHTNAVDFVCFEKNECAPRQSIHCEPPFRDTNCKSDPPSSSIFSSSTLDAPFNETDDEHVVVAPKPLPKSFRPSSPAFD